MTYRAFVSSTKQDLEKQRGYVTRQLRDAGLSVDPMENWPADASDPVSLSAKRARGCQFCVALIGFQPGTIAHNDPARRSITQIEIQAAKKAKAKVLYFLLADTAENRRVWPREFQSDSGQFINWRDQLQQSSTCSFFNAENMPEVLPAVTRQIMEWESKRRTKITVFMLMLVTILAIGAAGFSLFPPLRYWAQSQLLAFNDPIAFQYSRSDHYNVARLLDGRADIQDNSNFREEIRATKESFVMFANTFGSLRDYQTDFEGLLNRGVKLRFVVTDYSEDNRPNWQAFQQAIENLPASEEETRLNARNILNIILELKRRHPGLIDVRLNRKPIFYTLWLRDPHLSSALGHLGVTYYGAKSSWPAFRFSKLTGSNQIDVLDAQFDKIWRDARQVPDKQPDEVRD